MYRFLSVSNKEKYQFSQKSKQKVHVCSNLSYNVLQRRICTEKCIAVFEMSLCCKTTTNISCRMCMSCLFSNQSLCIMCFETHCEVSKLTYFVNLAVKMWIILNAQKGLLNFLFLQPKTVCTQMANYIISAYYANTLGPKSIRLMTILIQTIG